MTIQPFGAVDEKHPAIPASGSAELMIRRAICPTCRHNSNIVDVIKQQLRRVHNTAIKSVK
jgi:hypothetical protein